MQDKNESTANGTETVEDNAGEETMGVSAAVQDSMAEETADITGEKDAVTKSPEETGVAKTKGGPEPDADEGSGDTQVEVRDAADVEAEEAEDDTLPEPYVPKLTEKQQKTWQTIAGIACGAAVMLSLWAGSMDQDNQLLRWLFLIIFAAVMLIRNQIEKKTGILLRTFMKYFLISLAACLGIFVIWGLASGQFTNS